MRTNITMNMMNIALGASACIKLQKFINYGDIGVGAIFDREEDGILGANRGPKMAQWGPSHRALNNRYLAYLHR